MKNDLNDDYDKKIDNGLKKKELEDKYGAFFSQDNNLPPEVESQWLSSVEMFEEQFEKAERIQLYEYIGKPEYKLLADLKADELSVELVHLFQLLNDADISLDTLCEVDDSELYRFITEELFQHEMDHIKVPGMTSCFIYEEFHPNSKLDIEQAYDYFFRMTLGKMENIGGVGYDLLYIDTENYQDAQGIHIEKQKVVDQMNNFLSAFDSFKIVSNTITDLTINNEENKAVLSFTIHYAGLFENNSNCINFKGDGCFKLKPSEYGGWDINHVTLPGLNI
ncbi:MAG: hypothetical protein ACERKD_16325 [Prolixibacteraceae bacterium]